jgi:hypothetical protein
VLLLQRGSKMVKAIGDLRILVAEQLPAHRQRLTAEGFGLGRFVLVTEHKSKIQHRRGHGPIFVPQQFSVHCQDLPELVFGVGHSALRMEDPGQGVD